MVSNIYYITVNRKEKWDSSGANEAMNRMAASVPQGTKDYLSTTTGQLFNRDRLRSFSLCFGIGEERPFYVEKIPSLLVARVKHNLTFFYMNYVMFTGLLFCLFCLKLFVDPTAIIGFCLLGALWAYVIRQTRSGSLVVLGLRISEKHATIGLVGISALFLFYLLSGIFWWALFTSGFLVLMHAGLRDASMHQDGDDHVDMVGEVPGESASFLGDHDPV
eukprot:scaffold2817_cov130-Cylindrotheca_fusiformis.AAC.10